MKHIYYNLLLILAVLSLQSCLKEEENYFGKSSAERLIEAAKEYEAILSSKENGWVMDFFAESEEYKYGGFQMLCKFDQGRVTMAGAFTVPNKYTKAGEKVTSSYSILSSQGPILDFDTYNPVLHSYADPGKSTNPDGYAGDFEFVLTKVTEDEIEMRGLKNNIKMVMRPMEAGKDWKEYCNEVEILQENLKEMTRFAIEKSGQSVGYVTLWTTDNEMHDTEAENGIEIRKYTVSNRGINLYDSLAIDGTVIKRLDWNNETKTFTDLNTTSGIQFKSINIAYEQLLGTYKVTADNLDEPVTVTFTAKEDGKIRVSKELFGYEFDIDVYDNNKLGIESQKLGYDEKTGYYIKLVVAIRTNLIFQESSSFTYDYAYSGSWYRGSADKPELRFLKSAHTLLFFTSYTIGIRVLEYKADTQSNKDIVGYRTLLISNPIFTKQ